MALFKFTKNILKNKKIDVYNYGNMYRDFTYVDDTVDRVFKIFKKGPKFKKVTTRTIYILMKVTRLSLFLMSATIEKLN